MTKTASPAEKISFELFGKERELSLPTNRMLSDLALIRKNLGSKTGLVEIGGQEGVHAYFMIEARATLAVFLPDLHKELRVKDLGELDIFKTKEMLNVFIESIKPWLTDITTFLNGVNETYKEAQKEGEKLDEELKELEGEKR